MRAVSLLAALLVCLCLAAPAAAKRDHPPPPLTFYGVVSQAGLAAEDFSRMRANGIAMMRLQLSWKKIQREEGDCEPDAPLEPEFMAECDWSYYDRIIGGAAAAGVEVMPFLLSVPEFIGEHENTPPIRSPETRAQWTRFVRTLVGRYGPGGEFWSSEYPSRHPGAAPLPISRWQVWNEPNDGTYWPPQPDPVEYAELVRVTSEAIRGVDPAAEVILAGLFGTPNREHGGIRSRPYLRALLGSGDVAAHFDSLALHPYGPNLKRSKQQVKKTRRTFRRAGVIDRPLWLTEIGWASGGSHAQLSKSPRRQAKLLKRAFRFYGKRHERWNIAGITWFAWQDTRDPGACVFCAHIGLVTVERQEKPALGAYRRVALGQ